MLSSALFCKKKLVFTTVKILAGNQTSECTFIQYRGFLTRAKAGNLCLFNYSFFVICQEDEVVDSPSKGQVRALLKALM